MSVPKGLEGAALGKADTMLYWCHHRCSSMQEGRLQPDAMELSEPILRAKRVLPIVVLNL
eukprot:208053-Pelagomonas_calceolata.AAC.1